MLLGYIALAGAVELDFQAPATVRLFTKVAAIEAKGVAPGDDCDAAVSAALDDLRSKAKKDKVPTLVSVAWRAEAEGRCIQKKTGKTVLQSTVVLDAIAVSEGGDLPELPAVRVVPLAASLGAALGGMEHVGFTLLEDKVWLALPAIGAVGPGTPEGAAARLLVDVLLPDSQRWLSALQSAPEIEGAVLVAGDGGKKGSGAARVAATTVSLGDFQKGRITDFDVAAASRFAWQEPGGGWVMLSADAIPVEGGGHEAVELRARGQDEPEDDSLRDEDEP